MLAEMGAVPGSVLPATLRPTKPTALERKRLARDLAIYLAIEGGMSQRVAANAFGLSQPGILKAYRRIACRNSRV